MNKQKFTKIIQGYHNIPDEDRDKLHDLAKNYPYSQIIHTLVAKANNDARTDIASQTLNYAAMYATDRHVLREIIQETPAQSNQVRPSDPSPELTSDTTSEESQPSAAPGKKKITVNLTELGGDSELLRDEVLVDLEALKQSKATYLKWLRETNTPATEQEMPASGKTEDEKSTEKADPEIGKKKNKAPKKSTAKAEKAKLKEKKKKAAKKDTTPRKKASEGQIQEKPPLKDQQELIENFITKEPRINAKPLKSSESQPDLSVASTSFNEDLVSENLANIFVNQGKKEKAIDIYKKLIWKFPQKKAYFASLIERLQK